MVCQHNLPVEAPWRPPAPAPAPRAGPAPAPRAGPPNGPGDTLHVGGMALQLNMHGMLTQFFGEAPQVWAAVELPAQNVYRTAHAPRRQAQVALGLVRPGTAITPQSTMHAINVVLSNPGVCMCACLLRMQWNASRSQLHCRTTAARCRHDNAGAALPPRSWKQMLSHALLQPIHMILSHALLQPIHIMLSHALLQPIHIHAEPDTERPAAASSYAAATRSGVWPTLTAA